MKQQTFSDIEYSNRKRRTKREEFLETMEKIILDRFVHHCNFIMIEGDSYRMKERERITSTKRRGQPKKETETQIQESEVKCDAE